jgi:NAD(P)-dependent dehydrogenase (short-subunit alcohol dehydrogenase family)
MSGRLAGKRALVTGASSGLGKAMALAFAAEGSRLVLSARSESALAEVAEQCSLKGAEAHAIAADVSDRESVRTLFARAADLLGGLDVLVNNAGIGPFNAGVRNHFGPRGSVVEAIPPAEWDRILLVNLTGARWCLDDAFPLLSQGASILNITSITARVMIPNGGAYVTSKYMLDALTRIRARELEARGIRVNGLCPGATVDTGFFAQMPNRESFSAEAGPEVIVPAAIFLASDESRPITGQIYYGRWFNEQVAATGQPPRAGMP